VGGIRGKSEKTLGVDTFFVAEMEISDTKNVGCSLDVEFLRSDLNRVQMSWNFEYFVLTYFFVCDNMNSVEIE